MRFGRITAFCQWIGVVAGLAGFLLMGALPPAVAHAMPGTAAEQAVQSHDQTYADQAHGHHPGLVAADLAHPDHGPAAPARQSDGCSDACCGAGCSILAEPVAAQTRLEVDGAGLLTPISERIAVRDFKLRIDRPPRG